MIFTKKRKDIDFRPLKLFGQELRVSGEVKYLGVHLDARFTWNRHVKEKSPEIQTGTTTVSKSMRH